MVREKQNWFNLWIQDKESMISTMLKNMQSDLDAGYDSKGACIQRQMKQIGDYSTAYNKRYYELVEMDEAKANRWCYYDMRKRGVIA